MNQLRFVGLLILAVLCACRNDFLLHALHSSEPIIVRVGYVPGTIEPPLTMSGKTATKVNVMDFFCNNVRALFPGRECRAPRSLSEMTKLAITDQDHQYYTPDQALRIATQLGDDPTEVRIIILDGRPGDDSCQHKMSCVLGRATEKNNERVIALFLPEIIDQARREPTSGYPSTDNAYVMSKVVVHEFGHLSGLVNHGIPMLTPHEDEANARHCSNPACDMFHSGSDLSVLNWLSARTKKGASADIVFDTNCLLDVHAASTY